MRHIWTAMDPLMSIAVTPQTKADQERLAAGLQLAGALQNAARQACPILLEPVMALEVRVPRVSVGAVIDALRRRQARITGQEVHDDGTTESSTDEP